MSARLQQTLKRLKLLKGRGRVTTLLKLCQAGRLAGGLSISLHATPDEVLGPLTHALGGAAARVRVDDVRTGVPMVLEVDVGGATEKWELEDVAALAHNLNDLTRDDAEAKVAVVLGEWEDMLQLWCVPKAALAVLLRERVLDDARDAPALWRLTGPRPGAGPQEHEADTARPPPRR